MMHRDLRVHSRPAGVLERPFERLCARPPTAGVDIGLALQPPRSGEADVVPERLELGNDLVGDMGVVERRALRAREAAAELALDRRAQLEPPVAGRRGGLQGLGQNIFGPCEVAGAHRGPCRAR